MTNIPEDMVSIISDFPDEFDIELEDECYKIDNMSGMIEGVMQKYCIGLNGTDISSQIFIYNTAESAEEILQDHETIHSQDYRNALGQREPMGGARILYFVPEGEHQTLLEHDKEEREIIERFNEELEFLAMADGKDNFGGTYMHVFDL